MANYEIKFHASEGNTVSTLNKIDKAAIKIGQDLKKISTGSATKGILSPSGAGAINTNLGRVVGTFARLKSHSDAVRLNLGTKLLGSMSKLEAAGGRFGERLGRGVGSAAVKLKNHVASITRSLRGGLGNLGRGIGQGIGNLIPSQFTSVAAAVTALGGAILGLGYNVTKTLDAIDEVADRAAAINISTQGLQVVRESQKRAGIDPGQTDVGLLTLQQQLGKGFSDKAFVDLQNFLNAGGKGKFKKFDKEIKKAKDTGEAYMLLVKYLNEAAESGKKGTSKAELSKALGPIFGRGGKSMIDIILGGLDGLKEIAEEMQATGSLFSSADVDAANNMEKSFGRFSLSWNGFLLAIARPGFDAAIDGFNKLADVINELSSSAGAEVSGPFALLDQWIKSIDPKTAAATIKEKFNSVKSTLEEVWNFIKSTFSWMDKFTAAPFFSDSVATKGPNQGLPERQGKFAMILDPIKATLTSILDAVGEKIKGTIVDGFNKVKEILSGAWNDLVNSTFGTLFGLKGLPKDKSESQPGAFQKLLENVPGVISNSGRGGAKTTVVSEDGTMKPGSRGYRPPAPPAIPPQTKNELSGFASAIAAQRAELVGASQMMSDMSTIAAAGIKLSGTDLVNSISSLAAQIRAISIPQPGVSNPGQNKYAQPNQRPNPSNSPSPYAGMGF